jgi:DNA-binding SARP family transcriptional activator
VRERATRGLIAYLVLKRAPATMDELVEALWPGEAPSKARQRLWKAKRQAQRLLGDRLARQQASYTIDLNRLHTDIDELEELRLAEPLELDALENADGLLREEPLADVDYAWADGERRRLQAIQAQLLEQVAGARLDDGDASGALALAERLIELDRLNERGWCLAMDAEGALGNRQAVLARYERLRGELDERLGLRPGAEAKETYRRLLGQA